MTPPRMVKPMGEEDKELNKLFHKYSPEFIRKLIQELSLMLRHTDNIRVLLKEYIGYENIALQNIMSEINEFIEKLERYLGIRILIVTPSEAPAILIRAPAHLENKEMLGIAFDTDDESLIVLHLESSKE